MLLEASLTWRSIGPAFGDKIKKAGFAGQKIRIWRNPAKQKTPQGIGRCGVFQAKESGMGSAAPRLRGRPFRTV